jgi:hypothetical protein
LNKIEKASFALIAWVYLGVVFGFLVAATIGGRGGMFFVFLGVYAGFFVGVLRSIYLWFKYDASSVSLSQKQIVIKRVFFGFLYLFAIYTIAINMLYPATW